MKLNSGQREVKAALTLGFLSLTFAFLQAHGAPADGYEASIYAATPIWFWVGAGIAGAVALTALVYARSRSLFIAAIGLYVATTMSIVTLPITRGYFGYGQGDALTHLGWMQRILSQDMHAVELVYPGTHLSTILIHSTTGISVPRAMIFVMSIFVLAYLVFVPLVIRMIVSERSAIAIAVVAASLLLPVTNVSTFFDYHPFTLTAFALPIVLFFLFRYLGSETTGSGFGDLWTRSGKFLVFVLFSLVLLHPQVALDTLILSGTIACVQLFATRLPSTRSIKNGRRLGIPTVVAFALFAAWALRYEVVTRMFGYVTEAVGEFWATNGGTGGQTVTDSGSSLSDIGVSMVEVFGKLFFVHFLFSVLSGLIVLGLLVGRLDRDQSQRNDVVMYFAYGGITLTPFFLLHFLGNISSYFFRHIGFAMVLVTILGIFALHSAREYVEATGYGHLAKPVVVVITLGVVVFAMMTLFPSPFIYQTTPGVPAAEMNGHQTAFAQSEEGVPYSGLRQGVGRYEDALDADVPNTEHVTGENITAGRLAETADESYYLVVSDYDREIEVAGFRGLDYNQTAFDRLGANSDVSLVFSNGGMDIYYVNADGESSEAGGSSAPVTPRTDDSANTETNSGSESETAADSLPSNESAQNDATDEETSGNGESDGDESDASDDGTASDDNTNDEPSENDTDVDSPTNATNAEPSQNAANSTDSDSSGNSSDATEEPSENGTNTVGDGQSGNSTDAANGESSQNGTDGTDNRRSENRTDASDDGSGENATDATDGQSGNTDDTDDSADSVDGVPRISRSVTGDVSWQVRAAMA